MRPTEMGSYLSLRGCCAPPSLSLSTFQLVSRHTEYRICGILPVINKAPHILHIFADPQFLLIHVAQQLPIFLFQAGIESCHGISGGCVRHRVPLERACKHRRFRAASFRRLPRSYIALRGPATVLYFVMEYLAIEACRAYQQELCDDPLLARVSFSSIISLEVCTYYLLACTAPCRFRSLDQGEPRHRDPTLGCLCNISRSACIYNARFNSAYAIFSGSVQSTSNKDTWLNGIYVFDPASSFSSANSSRTSTTIWGT
jgi:hypothetical protein